MRLPRFLRPLFSRTSSRLEPARPWALGGALLALLPISAALWVHTASAAQTLANVDDAITVQRQRIAEDPTSAEAYNDLGNLLALRQDRAEAEEAFREALRLDPDSFSAHFNLAVLLRTSHRPAEAVEVLNRAVELEPESGWAHYQLGASHQALGHRKRATQAYARAFALDNRLALPDVNPLVIGNPLVTAAMLTRQDVPVADTTPRSYADPVTISQLLLPPPPPEGEGADATVTSAPEDIAPRRPAPGVGEVRPPDAATTTPPDAGAPGAERSAGGATSPTPENRRITNDDIRSLRILNQPAPPAGETAAPTPPSGGTRERTLEAPQRFRPGRRSSAQLDLELVPRSGSEMAPAAVL